MKAEKENIEYTDRRMFPAYVYTRVINMHSWEGGYNADSFLCTACKAIPMYVPLVYTGILHFRIYGYIDSPQKYQAMKAFSPNDGCRDIFITDLDFIYYIFYTGAHNV